MIRAFFILFCSLIFSSCSSKVPTLESRIETVFSYAKKENLIDEIVNTTNFDLFSLQNKNSSCKNLNIYLEKIAKGKPKEDMQHVRECLSSDSDGYYYMHLNDLFIIFGSKLSEGVIIFQEKEFYLGL